MSMVFYLIINCGVSISKINSTFGGGARLFLKKFWLDEKN
jgi:hypothetical protein